MSSEQQSVLTQTYQQIMTMAWADAAFKLRLLAEPAAVLREHGIELPAEVQVRIHEASAGELHLVLPAGPAELTEDQLDAVAGGNTPYAAWLAAAAAQAQQAAAQAQAAAGAFEAALASTVVPTRVG